MTAITLSEYAKKHGKSRSTAMKLYRQGRIKGAKLVELANEIRAIVVPENTPWPKPAKPGTLTPAQRAAWPRK